MARATFVEKALKDNPAVKKGQPYWWWKFRRGAKHYSATKPKQSHLTQSEFWGNVYGWQEEAETVPLFDEIEERLNDIKDQVEQYRDELEDKRNNMPDGLQEGPTGELLQERYEALDECYNTLDNIDTDGDFDDGLGEDALEKAKEAKAEEIWDEVRDALGGIGCS